MNHTFDTYTSVANTDSTFRAFGDWFSDALVALAASGSGLSKVSDSGTVDWATVVVPASAVAGVSSIYEIWKLEAASMPPIYLKFNFGRNTTAGWIVVQVGTAHLGSGNITTVSGSANLALLNQTSVLSVGKSFMGSDGVGIWIHLGVPNTNANSVNDGFFFFDRPRNSSGAPSATGAIAASRCRSGSNSVPFAYGCIFDFAPVVHTAITIPGSASQNFNPPCLHMNQLSSTVEFTNSLGKAQIVPWFVVTRNDFGPIKMMGLYNENDLSPTAYAPVNQPFAHLGATRTYKTIGDHVSSNLLAIPNTADGAGIAWWWDD